jgi:hypothetical protein
MITMGGTKSHKIPFLELARGLISRGHNVTFLNAFPPDSEVAGLEEITPLNLVFYVRNYTNWDLLGVRMSGSEAVPPADVLRYAYYVSNSSRNRLLLCMVGMMMSNGVLFRNSLATK